MKINSQNIPDIRFLDDVVDDCAVNGDMLVNELIFSYGRAQWNPKFIDE